MSVNEKDFSKLYNGELKEQFIDEITNNKDSKNTYYYLFLRTSKIEKEENKDLFEMTTDELEGVFYSLKARSVDTATNYISTIYKYLEWCIGNGYCKSNLKDFELNIRKYAEKFVSKALKVYYTREELFEYFKDIEYLGDQVILLCMFEGIRGKNNSEIMNMKIEHLKERDGKYYIDLYDTEAGNERLNFEISRDLYHMLISLNNLTDYINSNGNKVELQESEYILKRSINGKRTNLGKVSNSYFANKTIYFKKVFNNKSFQYRDIQISGMMYYLNEWLKEKGDRIITKELLEKAADKYDLGIYNHTILKEKTYSYSKLRSFIDIDFFEENYGEVKFA